MTRLLCIDFESGRITAWGKVSGGTAHRFGVMGPYDGPAMRQFPFDQAQLQQFRETPGDFMSKSKTVGTAPQDNGPEAA